MTLGQIRELLEAKVLGGEDHLARDITVGFACDLMSDVLAFATPGSFLLTGLTNVQVVRTAEMADLAGICFVRGKEPEEATTCLAATKGIPLFRTRLSMFETCGRLRARGLGGVGRTGGGSDHIETVGKTGPVAEGDE